MSADLQRIVLARLVEDLRLREHGQVDLGRPHKFERYDRPEALVWLNRGGAADIAKAKAFAEREGYTVFRYPLTEKDPLGRARTEIAAGQAVPR